jgi:hypothetical protein
MRDRRPEWRGKRRIERQEEIARAEPSRQSFPRVRPGDLGKRLPEVDADVAPVFARGSLAPRVVLPGAQPFRRHGFGHLPEALMVRPLLDQPTVIVWDRPGRALGDETPCRFDREQVVIGPLLADAVARALQERRQVGRGWQQHDAAGALEAGRAVRPVVPMQSANALQEDVDRGEIGDQEIGIDIEGLLERLRSNDDRGSRRRAFAEAILDRLI